MNTIRQFFAVTLMFGLMCLAGPGDAYAQKGGGSRPSFSGGSSRPSFSGGSKPSFSGGSKPSFSGGSKPSFSGGSKPAPSIKPAAPAPSIKPSFSGGSSPKTPAPNKTPTFSGGSSSPPPSKGSPTDKPKFGGGSTSPPTKTVTTTPIQGKTPTSVSKKPVAESFDKLSTTEARKTESRKAYQPAPTPASTYTTPGGKSLPIAKGDKSADYLRGRLDESHWQTRYQRTDVFYGGYYSRYPMGGPGFVYYHDIYHPYWNYWLLGQTLDVMSLWVYHHSHAMDQARLNALYSQNADLKARVAALERQGIPRDVTYTPRNVEADVMYNDGYVNAVYNPQPKVVDQYEYDEDPPVYHGGGGGGGRVLLWIFVYIPLMCLAVFCLYWVVFRYRW